MTGEVRKKLDIADITPEFVLENVHKIVWLRDDYLCMRDICKHDNDGLWTFLERCASVKEELRAIGHKFYD